MRGLGTVPDSPYIRTCLSVQCIACSIGQNIKITRRVRSPVIEIAENTQFISTINFSQITFEILKYQCVVYLLLGLGVVGNFILIFPEISSKLKKFL